MAVPAAVHLALALLVPVAAAATARAVDTGLGPGAGPWQSEPAEKHGLSSAALAAAATRVHAAAPQRHCVLVVKDGVLVHERYFGASTAASRYESDSLGKQGASIATGRKVTFLQAALLSIGSVIDRGAQCKVERAAGKRLYGPNG
jgi:hypothetical protein